MSLTTGIRETLGPLSLEPSRAAIGERPGCSTHNTQELGMTRKTLRYVPEEDHTRVNRAGVWAGEFVEPWAWRRGQRLD